MRNVDGCEHTAAFIKIVVNWWKILNVKCIGVDVRVNNKLQAAVQDPLEERLNTILQFGEMALPMKGGQGKHYKQFTRNTAQAIHHTGNGIVGLCRSLLRVSHTCSTGNVFNRSLRERIWEAAPGIWWNILYNCATNYRKGEHVQGFFIAIS